IGRRRLILRPERQRARDIAAKRFEQGEVVAGRKAERTRHRVALRFLRQEAGKEWTAFAPPERRVPLRQRHRERWPPLIGEPTCVIAKAHVAVFVELERANEPAVPPNAEPALHGFRVRFGGSMLTWQPSAASTANALPIWLVGFPDSRSTIKRRPTPAAPASSSWRSPASRLAARTIPPSSLGVMAEFTERESITLRRLGLDEISRSGTSRSTGASTVAPPPLRNRAQAITAS